jgi:hypothetical protein
VRLAKFTQDKGVDGGLVKDASYRKNETAMHRFETKFAALEANLTLH